MVSGSMGLGVFLEVGRPAGEHEEASEKRVKNVTNGKILFLKTSNKTNERIWSEL